MLRVVVGGAPTDVPVAGEADLLSLLRRHRVPIDAPCAGAGTCGGCGVRVVAGGAGPADGVERALLAPTRLAAGTRLACRLRPADGLVVAVPASAGGARHKADVAPADPGQAPPIDPPLRRRMLALPPPSLADPAPDLERLLRHAGCADHRLPLTALRALPGTLRAGGYRVAVIQAHEPPDGRPVLWAVEAADAGTGPWGVAVDLGTTTVAAFLVDLAAGRAVDAHAEPNRQSGFGADVVTRLAHAQASGVDGLQRCIAEQLQAMVTVLASRHGLGAADVVALTVAGNTTMLHALLGLDPTGIGEAPFAPVTTAATTVAAGEVGLSLHPAARVATLPGVSAYVGADTVAAVLASDLDRADGVGLLIDLGTNGEVVVGHAGWLLACSTAAGPAFEGARIRCGVGGVDGAVAGFGLAGSTTIGGAPAVGICGAGLLDVVAVLLDAGVIDDGGRLLPAGELAASVPAAVRTRCVEVDGRPAFVVVAGEKTRDGGPIVLTEGDVRELQLAKAAVAAGIETLLGAAGTAPDEVERVVLTGGFGSFLDPASAVRIGLLPPWARGRVTALGNAAGIGTVMAATSMARAARCADIAARTRTIELSGSAAFAEAYLAHIGFESPSVEAAGRAGDPASWR